MSLATTESIKVQIFGKEYEIDAGGLTPLEAGRLAGYVDEKMREISDKLHIVDTQKVAVLTALNIAYEMFAVKETGQNMTSQIREKINDIMQTIDDAISDPKGVTNDF